MDGTVRNGRFLYWGFEDTKPVTGFYFPDWDVCEDSTRVSILRIGEDTSGLSKEYLLVLRRIAGWGYADCDSFERVGIHRLPLTSGWGRIDWGKAQTKQVQIA
jgi:hypothetical protein